MVGGFFARWFPLHEQLAQVAERARELAAAGPSKPPATMPRVQRLDVVIDYSQVYLEPFEPTGEENAHEIEWDEANFDRGMCLFPTKVAIATPAETAQVRATIETSASARRDIDELLANAVQAVAFPLDVRGPLALRSCTDLPDTADPIYVPAGSYDVLATFSNESAMSSGLRSFELQLTLFPAGALGAPRTFCQE